MLIFLSDNGRSIGSGETSIVARAANFDFSNSKWIWTSELVNGNAPPGFRPFRKDFVAPPGKVPVFAEILITVDNGLTMYVNGVQVGTGGNFHFAERFCAKLKPCDNVFAVSATNADVVPNPAGVLAAIQITYQDGSTDVIVTDSTWRTNTIPPPAGFEQPSFDDSAWPAATVEGNYGVAPWGAVAIPTDPATVSFANTNWIWTNEIVNGQAPAGARAFRRTYTPPAGLTVTTATILITTDNEYSLYVNGQVIGSGTNWPTAQRYRISVPQGPTSSVVFAVYAVNTAGPAGLLAEIELNMQMVNCETNCTPGAYIITDSGWKANTGVPSGFQLPGYDDSSWPAATVEAPYGAQPWGTISVPATDTPQGGPLPGAPP
jgi:hypothetical protein